MRDYVSTTQILGLRKMWAQENRGKRWVVNRLRQVAKEREERWKAEECDKECEACERTDAEYLIFNELSSEESAGVWVCSACVGKFDNAKRVGPGLTAEDMKAMKQFDCWMVQRGYVGSGTSWSERR